MSFFPKACTTVWTATRADIPAQDRRRLSGQEVCAWGLTEEGAKDNLGRMINEFNSSFLANDLESVRHRPYKVEPGVWGSILRYFQDR